MDIDKFKQLKKGDYILFNGKEFYIPWDVDKVNSIPLCTEEQYDNFETSYGHIYIDDNKINRFGETIGTIEDIELKVGKE